MNSLSKVWIFALSLFIFCTTSHSTVHAQSPKAHQRYQSDLIKGLNGQAAKYLEAVVPADFSLEDLFIVKIVFVSPGDPTNVLGSIEQAYTIRQSYVQDSYTTTYSMTKKGSPSYIDQHGAVGLVDNMILKNTQSFQFVMSTALVDDLALNYRNAVGESVPFPLTYVGLVQDTDARAQADDSPSSRTRYDKLLNDDSEKSTTPQAETKSSKGIFDLDYEVDINALVNKRDYDVFVLSTRKPAERGDHTVQIGYYIPTQMKEGSLLRVLALKKDVNTGALLGSVEFNYYVNEIVVDNGLRIYMLTDMASVSTKTGELIELYPMEREAFTEASAVSILEKDGIKILGIQHGEGGSAAVYEGTFSF